MSKLLKDYSYDFPNNLIARYPCDKRGDSRLLVLNKQSGSIDHSDFSTIVDHFESGDVLVFNNSKVFPCRLVTKRETGGKQEILLIRQINDNTWEAMINASHKVKAGDKFQFENLAITINTDEGNCREVSLNYQGTLSEVLKNNAQIPLPPYMHREADNKDTERYQTVYAKSEGSVAAPTAGLHFTNKILQELSDKGVLITELTLHVGPGTFLPVRSEKITDHKMHTEYYTISEESCHIINEAKRDGRKITAVGTTTTRVLESLAAENSELKPKTGKTSIFIYPPYNFKITDRLITNFHLPESTLLMLVSAFAGRKRILNSYREAVEKNYRFFSYGDCMIIG